MKSRKIIFNLLACFIFLFGFSEVQANKLEGHESNSAGIIIQAVDLEGRPIEGFVYEVKDTKGNIKTIDLTNKSREEIQVENGDYVITEVVTKEGYKPIEPISITLPYKPGDGNTYNTIQIYPKHHKIVGIEEEGPSKKTETQEKNPPEKRKTQEDQNKTGSNPKTGDQSIQLSILVLVSALIVFAILNKKNKYNKK